MLKRQENKTVEKQGFRDKYPSFLRLMEFSPDAIFIYEDYIIKHVNLKAIEFCEVSGKNDLIGMDIRNTLRIHEDYNEIINERVRILESGEAALPYIEQKFVKASGEILHAEVAASSFLVEGKLCYMLVARDITERKKLEETVRRNQETYYKLINFFPDAVILSKNGIISFANQQGLNLLGAENIWDIVGRNILDFSHQSHMGSSSRKLDEMLNNKEALPLTEHKIINLKGREVDIEVKSMFLPLGDEDVNVTVLRDITERKRTENQIIKSKDLYKKLVKLLPEGVFVTFGGKFQLVNDSGVKLFGEDSRDDIIGKSITDFIYPEDADKLKSRRSRLYNDMEGPSFIQHRIVQTSGKVIDVEAGSAVVELDGRPAVLTVARDITERKIYEQFLKESDERYRKLLELIPDGVFITHEKHIVWANENAARLMGLKDASELVGVNPLSFLPDFIKRTVVGKMNEVLQSNGTSKSLKHKLYRRDGGVITVDSISTSFYHNNEKMVLTAIRDLSERHKLHELRRRSEESRRLLDEAKQYDRIKTEFFANMSHEIRTPLNVVLSSQQLISAYINNGAPCCAHQQQVNKHLQIMRQNCNRLLRLFNNIIDITKIDSGFVNLNLKNYNIINVVEETVLSVSEYIEGKGISLTFDTEVEEVVMAVDGEKLERVILNLLSNATKFTNPGGSIEVHIKQLNNDIIISVKDSGIGIPTEKQNIIFERFIQVDKSFTRNHEGSGIGLSIVKSLVELHGGSISIKSTPGAGSEFLISLPITANESGEVSMDWAASFNSEGAVIEFSDIYTY